MKCDACTNGKMIGIGVYPGQMPEITCIQCKGTMEHDPYALKRAQNSLRDAVENGLDRGGVDEIVDCVEQIIKNKAATAMLMWRGANHEQLTVEKFMEMLLSNE